MTVVGLLIQREMIALTSAMGYRPNPWLTYAFGLTIISFAFWSHAVPGLLFMLLAFITVETLNKEHRNLLRQMSTLYCSMYAPVAMLTFIALRNHMPDPDGFFFLLLTLAMVWGNDSFAYYGGRTFGRHLMAPHLSPKKTWEGFAAGVAGAAVAFWVVYQLVPGVSVPMNLTWPLIFVASVFGPIGDLAESKVKRAAGAKDSSTLLPGHGGVFDRFDSLLLVGPAVYLYLRLLQIAG